MLDIPERSCSQRFDSLRLTFGVCISSMNIYIYIYILIYRYILAGPGLSVQFGMCDPRLWLVWLVWLLPHKYDPIWAGESNRIENEQSPLPTERDRLPFLFKCKLYYGMHVIDILLCNYPCFQVSTRTRAVTAHTHSHVLAGNSFAHQARPRPLAQKDRTL